MADHTIKNLLGGAAGIEVDEHLDAALPASAIDLALARLCSSGLPMLVDCAAGSLLPEVLTAINPRLSLADLDKACGKLEDLTIMLLAETREARHEIAGHIESASAVTPAGKMLGGEALELIDDLEEAGALSPEEADANRKLINGQMRAEPRGRGKRE